MVKKHPNKKSTKVSFRALPDEVRSWKEMAKADDRSLSNWIRSKVNKSTEDNKQTEPKPVSEEPTEAEESDPSTPSRPPHRKS